MKHFCFCSVKKQILQLIITFSWPAVPVADSDIQVFTSQRGFRAGWSPPAAQAGRVMETERGGTGGGKGTRLQGVTGEEGRRQSGREGGSGGAWGLVTLPTEAPHSRETSVRFGGETGDRWHGLWGCNKAAGAP